jgi:hypothetical protein
VLNFPLKNARPTLAQLGLKIASQTHREWMEFYCWPVRLEAEGAL